jgi:hypothetical protein
MITCTFHASVNPSAREDNGAFCLCWLWTKKCWQKEILHYTYTMRAHNAVGIFAYFFVVFPQGVLPFKPAEGKQKAVG